MLTSDAIARGVIAAARVYGDDPVSALTAKTGPARRSLFAAAVGVSVAATVPVSRLRRILKLSGAHTVASRKVADPLFVDASAAAARAADYAFWRPEARESVVAGSSLDGIAPTPVVDDVPEPTVEAVTPRAKPALGGAITGAIRPTLTPRPLAEDELPLSDRILQRMRLGAVRPRGLASVLGVNELAVTRALQQLVRDGLALDPEDEPAPAHSSPRDLLYRLAPPLRAVS